VKESHSDSTFLSFGVLMENGVRGGTIGQRARKAEVNRSVSVIPAKRVSRLIGAEANLDSLNSQTKCNTFCIRCCNGTTL
jgi:hypothetical protein